MNFEDEAYVRLFIRDSANWIRMSWQARAILPSIMKKLDRAGMLDLEADGAEGITNLAEIIRFPFDVVREGLDDLLKRKTLVAREHTIIMPNFTRAQSFAKSDAERARDYRERKRAEKMSQADSSDRYAPFRAVEGQGVLLLGAAKDRVTPNRDGRDAVKTDRSDGQNGPLPSVHTQNGIHEPNRTDIDGASQKPVTARDAVTLPVLPLLPDLPSEEETPRAPARAREEQAPGHLGAILRSSSKEILRGNKS